MSLEKKEDPFAALDGRKASVIEGDAPITTVESLKDADEALRFLEDHPRAFEIAEEGNAILEDPVQLKKLVRKIDLTIAPLLAAVYFLQFLDKTTLSYTAVMGIRTDTHLVGQDYSDLSMLFYIGILPPFSRQEKNAADRQYRVSCCRISHTIPRTAFIPLRTLSRGQYYDMGVGLGLSCCMYNLCWVVYRTNIAWYI